MKSPEGNTTPAKPYHTPAINLVYDLLFCDDVELYKNNFTGTPDFPWNILFNNKASVTELEKIITDTKVGSRAKTLAANALKAAGQPLIKKQLYGIVIEVGLENGLDTLAAYRDGSARYINHAENMVVWETPDAESNALINLLFVQGAEIVAKIGPWKEARCPHPPTGNVRISFLVSDGLYFGEGPIHVLFKDKMAGPALATATELLQFLANK